MQRLKFNNNNYRLSTYGFFIRVFVGWVVHCVRQLQCDYMAVFCVLVQGGSGQEDVQHTGLSNSSKSDEGSSYYVNICASQLAMSLPEGCGAL